MKAKPTWFSESNYIADKVTALKAQGYIGATVETVTESFKAIGGAWNHYEMWGYKESYTENNAIKFMNLKDASGNVVFDTQLYCESKLASLNALGKETNGKYTTWQTVAEGLVASGISPYDHYVNYGAAEGLTINYGFNAGNFFTAKLQYLQKTDLSTYGSWSTAQVAKYFADHSLDAYQNWLSNGNAEGITAALVSPTGGDGGQTFYLTTDVDNLVGTGGNDTFLAYGPLTFNSGDRIDGGNGRDVLEADLYKVDGETITAITTNLEVVKFNARGKTGGNSGGENYTDARIDAERMRGVEEFWSTKSRADVDIEDVVTDSNKMTSVFQSSDPGQVDFKVTFNSQNLRPLEGTTTGKLALKLIDGQGAAMSPSEPLLDNAYDTVIFHFNNKQYEVKFDVVKGATATYDQLLAAIQKGIDGNAELKAGGVTAAITGDFTFFNRTGQQVTGKTITLSSAAGPLEALTGDGWKASGTLPPNNNLSAEMDSATSTTCPLIQTNIGLDNVGSIQWDDTKEGCLPDNAIFGSRSGNMVVGGSGARDGVERFDVKADRGSWLNSLSSTNNTLRMINLTSTDWNGDGISGKGQVFIGAHPDTKSDTTGTNPVVRDNQIAWQDRGRLLGTGTLGDDGKPTAAMAGIWDVKQFDGSTYGGDINIAAQFTAAAYDKYMKDVDGLKTVYGDFAPQGDFNYTFGTGNDTLNMLVHGGIATDKDFILNMNMGAGNDFVNFDFEFQTANQVINQAGTFVPTTGNGTYTGGLKNINIDAGAGDDTVRTWGNANGDNSITFVSKQDQAAKNFTGYYGAVNVKTGDGSNLVYAAQEGVTTLNDITLASGIYGSIWVLNANTTTAEDRAVYVEETKGAQPLDNNNLSTSTTWKTDATKAAGGSYEVKVLVDFMGIQVEANVGKYVVAAAGNTYNVSAADINKAVMTAINNNDVLNKLLVVKDGAGNALIVESLISGDYSHSGDFTISFTDKLSTATSYSPIASLTNDHLNTSYQQIAADKDGAAVNGQDEHYYGFTDITGGAGNDILVTGYADAIVKSDGGNDTIIVGNTTYNKITAGIGADHIILGHIGNNDVNGNSVTTQTQAYDMVHQAKGDSSIFNNSTTVTGTGTSASIKTGTFDVIQNFDKATSTGGTYYSDHLVLDNFAASATTITGNNGVRYGDFTGLKGILATDNSSGFVQGTYDSITGTFVADGAGVDMFLIYDADATTVKQYEGVVLTGVGASTTITYTANTQTDAGFLTIS